MEPLRIKLKQHTPIIHFQHSQDGATLRASEVKPKLDRFILTKLGEAKKEYSTKALDFCERFLAEKKKSDKCEWSSYDYGYAFAKYRGWLTGKGEHGALNYKMRIEASNIKEEYFIISRLNPHKINLLKNNGVNTLAPSPYFAQEEFTDEIVSQSAVNTINWNKLEKKGVMYDEVCIIVFSLHQKILELVDDFKYLFFASHNFGTRQSKGFGGFYPKEAKVSDFKKNLRALGYKRVFVRSVKINNNRLTEIFKVIDKDYKKLKSGINGSESELRSYLEKNNIDWEKDHLKKYAEGVNSQLAENIRFERLLLGLAGNINYPRLGKNIKIEHLPEEGADKIERFQSPLLFKIFENEIFLIAPNNINSKLKNQQFRFSKSETDSIIIPSIKDKDNIAEEFYLNFLDEKLDKWDVL